jgi:hypothetical protein
MMAMMMTVMASITAMAALAVPHTAAPATMTSLALVLAATAALQALRMSLTSGVAVLAAANAIGPAPAGQAGANARHTTTVKVAGATIAAAAAMTGLPAGQREQQQQQGGTQASGQVPQGTIRIRIATCCHRRRRPVAAWVLQAACQRLQAVWAQPQLRHVLRRVMRSVILSARSLKLSLHAWQLSLSG